MYGQSLKDARNGAAYVHVYLLVELEAAARAEQYAERCRYALASYAVLFGLFYGREATYGVVYVHVYGALAAPWRAVCRRCAVVGNPYHGVVIVDERAALDMLCP